MDSTKKNYTSAFIIVTVLFFLWGFITVLVDSLIPRLKDVFELSYFQAGLVQFAFFAAYFFFSVPAGWLLSKIGYQKGVVLGLSIMAIGCLLFWPAAGERMFGVFLLGYFTLAAGITVLQVAANPYVAVLGSEDGASSRLNLSQAFNSLGTAIAPLIGASYLLSDTIMSSDAISAMTQQNQDAYFVNEAAAVQTPFLVLASCIGIIALLFMFIRLPKILQESPRHGYIKLLSDKYVLMGVLGIFLYVGAEVAIGSYLANYFMEMNMASIILNNETMSGIASSFLNTDLANVDAKAVVGTFVVFYWSGAMVGRFIGSYLTRVIKPGFVLAIFACIAIVLLLISMSTTGLVAMWSILAVGLFNSIMFPTIFTLTLDGQGDFKPQISGLLCMAIVGGALVPPLFGLLTDSLGFKMAFILVIICYAYILFFGYLKQKNNKTFQAI